MSDSTTLSTIRPYGMAWYGNYETAISFDNQDTWYIIEGYDTEEDAIKGHKKYEQMSTSELEKLEFIG